MTTERCILYTTEETAARWAASEGAELRKIETPGSREERRDIGQPHAN